MTQEDIRNGLASGSRLSQLEEAAHVTFVLEAALSMPVIDRDNNVVFKLKPSVLDSEHSFIMAINDSIVTKARAFGNRRYPSIDRFQREISKDSSPDIREPIIHENSKVSHNQKVAQLKHNNRNKLAKQNIVSQKDPTVHQKEETLLLFRAAVREKGVEILFPLDTQDKVRNYTCLLFHCFNVLLYYICLKDTYYTYTIFTTI